MNRRWLQLTVLLLSFLPWPGTAWAVFPDDSAEPDVNGRGPAASVTEKALDKTELPAASAPPVVENVLAKLERLTGLARQRPVPLERMSRAEVRAYIERELREQLPAEKVRVDEQLYKTLGLIPAEMDIRSFLVELYSEQAGGYYDPKRGCYVIADWIDPVLQETVMAHELTHALQDQQVPFQPLLDRFRDDDDRSLALSAVLEGSATLAMLAYAMDVPVREISRNQGLFQLIGAAASFAPETMPVFSRAPAFLRETMLFPYVAGSEYIRRYLETHEFKDSALLLQHPPAGTSVILHPEQAAADPAGPVRPVEIPATECGVPDSSAGSLRTGGEFLLRQFLRVGLPGEPDAAATAGWAADGLRLCRADDSAVWVAWKIRWADPAAAVRFARLLEGWKTAAPVPTLRSRLVGPATILLLVRKEARAQAGG